MIAYFSVVPAAGLPGRPPPIHRLEVDAHDFRELECKEWHIGVPQSPPAGSHQPVFVIVQNPGPGRPPPRRALVPPLHDFRGWKAEQAERL